METLTINVPNEHARRLLEELQALGVLSIQPAANPTPSARAPHERTFNALSYSTKGFKFDREEANER